MNFRTCPLEWPPGKGHPTMDCRIVVEGWDKKGLIIDCHGTSVVGSLNRMPDKRESESACAELLFDIP
jgi:hypothetical protein